MRRLTNNKTSAMFHLFLLAVLGGVIRGAVDESFAHFQPHLLTTEISRG
jgi:hypothetical protein